MDKLAGKICLVTGGGSGIGLAVARTFLDEGARVAIAGRDEAKLRQAAQKLAGGDRLTSYAMDVAISDQVQTAVRQLSERWGPVEILVNNAGLNLRERSVRELTPESWQCQPGRCLLLHSRGTARYAGTAGRRYHQH